MSLVTQTRVISFLAGVATAGVGYISTKRYIWHSTAKVAEALPNSPPAAVAKQAPLPLVGPELKGAAARTWNQGVDAVFKPLIEGSLYISGPASQNHRQQAAERQE